MAIKRSKGENIFELLNTVFMIFMIVITIYPFLHIAFASVSNPELLIKHQGLILAPMGFDINSYKSVIENPNIISGYKNTLFIVIVGTTINIIMTSLGAYVLSRKKLYWKKLIMFLIVFTMFFDGGLVPFYLVVKGVGITNTLWAVIIPFSVNTYNLIIMRTYFMSIPDSMEESAKIDGANDYIVLVKIIIPLAMPAVAVMILFYGVSHWNGWFYSMIFLREKELYPLQLILREIIISSDTESMMTEASASDKAPLSESIKYATIMVSTIPILLIYPFLQKYFVKGVMVGALKG